MRIEQLHFILEINRYHSMKIASEKLFITPQALSSAVKSLEEELGIQIFHRSNKGIRLTENGQLFIAFADATLANYREFLGKIRIEPLASDAISGELILYLAPIFSESLLPKAISSFKQRYPHIPMALVPRNTLTIARILHEKMTPETIATLILPFDGEKILKDYLPKNPQDFSYKILNRNTYLACVAKDSPFCEQKSISLKTLLSFPLVDYCSGEIGSAPLVPLLKKYQPDLTISLTISTFSQWTQAIGDHMGIGVMNALFAQKDFSGRELLDDLCLLKIKEPVITYNVFVYDKHPDPCVEAFLAQFADWQPRRDDPLLQTEVACFLMKNQ